MNLKEFLKEKAARFGDKTAIVYGPQRLSFKDVDIISNKVANVLKTLINKGDCVVILLPNTIEFVTVYLGAVKMGGIAVPLDAKYKASELSSIFANCQPSVLVAETGCLEQLMPHLTSFKSVKTIIEVGAKYKGKFLSYDEIIDAGSAREIEVAVGADETAHLGYTSGPTSHPTGAILTHNHLLTETAISVTAFRQTQEDVVMLFALPMNHVFGLVAGLLGSLMSGSRLIILPGLSMSSLIEVIEREKGTVYLGVPYVFALLVRMAEQEGLHKNISSLRLCISAGDCLPDSIAWRFKKLFGRDIDQLWGLTETTATVTCTAVSKEWKLGSAGKVIPGWAVKVIDDKGRELPTGQSGELIVGGGPLMLGYYNNPADTARILKNGWVYTGDIGKIDEDGDVFITGRKKNMLIYKGQNIYPIDIENVLCAHLAIDEAVVVGVPDELRGEVVGAAIIPQKGQIITDEEIKRHCRQYLINYKVPRQIMFLSSFPIDSEGAIDRDYLKKLFAKALTTT